MEDPIKANPDTAGFLPATGVRSETPTMRDKGIVIGRVSRALALKLIIHPRKIRLINSPAVDFITATAQTTVSRYVRFINQSSSGGSAFWMAANAEHATDLRCYVNIRTKCTLAKI